MQTTKCPSASGLCMRGPPAPPWQGSRAPRPEVGRAGCFAHVSLLRVLPRTSSHVLPLLEGSESGWYRYSWHPAVAAPCPIRSTTVARPREGRPSPVAVSLGHRVRTTAIQSVRCLLVAIPYAMRARVSCACVRARRGGPGAWCPDEARCGQLLGLVLRLG